MHYNQNSYSKSVSSITRYYKKKINMVEINITLILEKNLRFGVFSNKWSKQHTLNIVKKIYLVLYVAELSIKAIFNLFSEGIVNAITK